VVFAATHFLPPASIGLNIMIYFKILVESVLRGKFGDVVIE
tara:strand:- start:3910 stop:4032 length:123 start_codon:yes stop_codon:yes gene_type:complete